ncbi:hypothetical protein [Methanomassiliicoccus luminyensis]|jgi:hypothetical protein|uniref:hypothetical protein n=1 Tax=Methanomassiliicoccus luminyensis TaxID=1080712 RepID=UPI000377F205|nr:hypothetical protein [Methanomassiliicoccus luminyensis]
MTPQIDRMTQYLISNGDVPAVTNQTIYEYAWGQGIRPVMEERLKPERFTRKRRQPRHGAARTAGAAPEEHCPAELLSWYIGTASSDREAR